MGIKKRAAVVLVVLLLAAGSFLGYRGIFARGVSAIKATGTIEATSVELTAKTPGAIKTLSVQEGDSVKAGQPVAELSRNDLTAQRERDAMALLKAEAQLADLNSGARAQEREEAAANANMARVSFDKANTDLARKQTLFDEGAISQEELDRARVSADLEKYRLQAAEARLSLLESGNRPELISAARAEVERSKAVLKATDAMLEDLKVYSPINGVIVSKNYEKGEYVQMGASVATVADLNDLRVKVYIPTDDLPAIKLGQKVQVAVSGEAKVFEGVVAEIASRGEFTPKSIQTKKERTNVVFGVKIRINNGGGILKPGMPADVTFDRR